MATRGIIRNLDNLGRVTFPKEARTILGIEAGDPVEIYVQDGEFRVKAVRTQCVCCGAEEDKTVLVEQNGVLMCTDCIKKFSQKIG